MRRSTKNDTRADRDAEEADRTRHGADVTPTMTACPVQGCGLPQRRCPSGVTCDDGHGHGEPNDIVMADAREKKPASKSSALMPFDSPRDEDLSAGWLDEIVERVFAAAPVDDMERVEKALRVGGASGAGIDVLTDALDDSEDNARVAHRLYCEGALQREMFEIDAEIRLADLWARGVERLQAERARVPKAKTITDQDVRSWIAHHAPDEWRALVRQRKRVELAVDHLRRLAELARTRCGTNETLLQKKR